MIYIILTGIAAACFIFFTNMLDRQVRINGRNANALSITLLMVTIESLIFFLTVFFKGVWIHSITKQTMRIVFLFDGFFLVSFSFGLFKIAGIGEGKIATVLKYLLYAFVVYIVYGKFQSIELAFDKGIIIGSEYLFYDEARSFFPWTWVTLYSIIYRFLLPTISFMILMIMQEFKATQLDIYQYILIGVGIVVMWSSNLLISIIQKTLPAFSLNVLYPYLFMIIITLSALNTTSVPSGRGFLVTIIKYITCFIFPASVLAAYVYFFQPVDSNADFLFIFGFVILGAISVISALYLYQRITNSTRIYATDYESSLEKQLATIDFEDEMDLITNQMYEIFRRNVESSSFSIYILTEPNKLTTAYTSTGRDITVDLSNPIFDHLLNEEKTVVAYSEIEKLHALSPIQNELEQFFKDMHADAFIVLNEGHNIFGLITLGKKVSGDHFKEYDVNVLTRLYTYFFVFGYYMRNISNRDIIGIVNREIRMSSQIITSIQENIDKLDNRFADVGYMMVPAHNIGGEFVDMIRLTDKRHLFVVGDLSGKGIAASMNMVILKSIIRTYLAETHDFKELVVKINKFIRNSLRKGTIFAGLFALIDFTNDTMYYINCGIPVLFMYTQVYNNVIEIQGSGHILGFVEDISPFISVKSTKLHTGDVVMACTDGLIQSHSLRGEEFGKERVQQAILNNSTYPAQRMAQFTFDALIKFMSKEMEDDVSILLLKYGSVQNYDDIFANIEESSTKEEVKSVEEKQSLKDEIKAHVEERAGEIKAHVEEKAEAIKQSLDDLESRVRSRFEDKENSEIPQAITNSDFEPESVIRNVESSFENDFMNLDEDVPKTINVVSEDAFEVAVDSENTESESTLIKEEDTVKESKEEKKDGEVQLNPEDEAALDDLLAGIGL